MRAPNRRALTRRCPMRLKQEHLDAECFRGHKRSEEHTSELQSPCNLVCRLLLEKKHARFPQVTPSPKGVAHAEHGGRTRYQSTTRHHSHPASSVAPHARYTIRPVRPATLSTDVI